MVTIEDGKIRIPVEIILEDKQAIDDIFEKSKQIRDNLKDAGIPVSAEPEPSFEKEEPGKDTPADDVIAEGNLQDLFPEDDESEGTNPFAGFKKGARFATAATNPETLIFSELLGIAPEIGAALIASGFVEQLVERLFAPGGPFDIRFKRETQTETLGLISLHDQQALRVGTNQIIVAPSGGFRNLAGGAYVGSNYRDIKNYGVARIGLAEKITGWRPQ